MREAIYLIIILSAVPAIMAQHSSALSFPDRSGNEESGNELIFAPGIVSTNAYNHASVTISPDWSELYWASEDESLGHKVIWRAKIVDDKITTPEVLDIARDYDGDCPMLSPDGKRLYFLSNRPLISDQNRKRERIWYAELGESGWKEAIALDPSINGKHLHWQVSIDNNYNIYFGSERSGSKGKDDIFYSEYQNGKYSNPVSLPNAINTVYHESTPFVAPDGSYLLFVRAKYGDNSYPSGLYISYRGEEGEWQESIYLGGDVDCSACPYVSPDEKYLFFKKDGKEFKNVYWINASFINRHNH